MARTRIILDNDGVNIDSEDVAMRVMDDWGVDFVRGHKPDADLPKDYIYTTYPGTSSNAIVEALITKFDLPLGAIVKRYKLNDVPQTIVAVGLALADVVTIATNERFQAGLKSVPGTTPALTAIHTMFGLENVALMTTSRADRMDISLMHAVDPHTGENARLHEFFPKGPRRRSGYDHANKYDEGFAALKWDPAESIIVEDSLSGVSKARAGRSEVAVIGTVAARFYTDKAAQADILLKAGADIVISDMLDLPLVAKWIKDGKPELPPDFRGKYFLPSETPVTPAPRIGTPQKLVV